MAGHIAIIVQNLPVPRDRRVWLEAQALRDAGFRVSVICPQGPGDSRSETLDGVRIHRYSPPRSARGLLSYGAEFVYCWLRTASLMLRVNAREGVDVIQACNPPDTYWALALPFKVAGKKFVFDQHDLCPELYESRFPSASRALVRGLRILERASYLVADHVIVTNESYRETAMRRGSVPIERTTVVRSGPDESRFRRSQAVPHWKAGRRYLCAYLGVMGPQDGVDLALRAAAKVVALRDDVHFIFMGTGDCLDELLELARQLDIERHTTFTGWADDATIVDVLSTADLGLCPDPLSPLNDVSTMNKTLEYMAMGLPMVAFDLKETRYSAGDASVYIPPNDTDAFARAIVSLLGNARLRKKMGREGRQRIEEVFAWRHQVPGYIAVMERLTSGSGEPAFPGTSERPRGT